MTFPLEDYANEHNPNIFSRGALELTFKLLRHRRPSLAMSIQNLMTRGQLQDQPQQLGGFGNSSYGTPLNQQSVQPRQHSDKFSVNVDAHTIGQIVSQLTEIGQNALQENDRPSGQLILLRSLIQDWMELAEWVLQQDENHG